MFVLTKKKKKQYGVFMNEILRLDIDKYGSRLQ